MASYIEPLKTAVLIFPFLTLLIAVPFLIRQYRQYGRFIFSKALILYTFIFYLLCAYFLVILPLPSRVAVAQMAGPRYELQLGKSLLDFLQQTDLQLSDPNTYLPALRQSVLLEPLFNLLLLLPLGVYLRYYFRFNLRKTILCGFLLSLFFEVTQLTGLYFIYSRPYRLFDVNDLLHNTLGAAAGYLAAPALTFMLPTRQQLDESAFEKGRQVTLTRRLVAAAVDWLLLAAVEVLFDLLTAGSRLQTLVGTGLLRYTIEVLLYFVLLNYLLKGQTLGKKLVKIRVLGVAGERAGFWALFKRYGILYLLFTYLNNGLAGLTPFLNGENHTLQLTALVVFLILFALWALFIANLLLAFILRKRHLFYERASRTQTVSTLEKGG